MKPAASSACAPTSGSSGFPSPRKVKARNPKSEQRVRCAAVLVPASASLHVDVPADLSAAGKVVAPTALDEGPHGKIKALFEEFDLGSEVATLSLVGAASLSELLACEQQLRLRLQRLPDRAGRIQFIRRYLKNCFEEVGG